MLFPTCLAVFRVATYGVTPTLARTFTIFPSVLTGFQCSSLQFTMRMFFPVENISYITVVGVRGSICCISELFHEIVSASSNFNQLGINSLLITRNVVRFTVL